MTHSWVVGTAGCMKSWPHLSHFAIYIVKAGDLQSTKSPPVTAEKGAQLVFPIPAYTILKTVLCHSHGSWPTKALFAVAGCIFRWPCMWLSWEKWGKTVPWDFPALYTPPQTTTAVRVQEKRQKGDISSAQMYPATRESVCNLINILIASTTG